MTGRLLREPLVHFLAIGALLFLLYALVGPEAEEGQRIVVSRAAVDDMKVNHAKTWGRPPTSDELRRLIDIRVVDEISYREGLAMGLDRDDALIKRRVRQKYELIAEEDDGAAPTDAELSAYLSANAATFRALPQVTFMQVKLPGDATDAQIAAMKHALASGTRPESVGEPTLLPLRGEAMSMARVAKEFGDEFADALAQLPEKQWEGPVPSGYGRHLVLLEHRTQAPMPALKQVRADVVREWESERRAKARAARLVSLRERYEVVVEADE